MTWVASGYGSSATGSRSPVFQGRSSGSSTGGVFELHQQQGGSQVDGGDGAEGGGSGQGAGAGQGGTADQPSSDGQRQRRWFHLKSRLSYIVAKKDHRHL
ncbi:hypothetical protein OIU85_017577 [Salix viminalis]|uniref:Uncharacterized protein n=1 Tax=Salix viminalis TaxID=40686 RepID=A0A9Q0V8H2_SALVM|nr:hypothetical protein OIU85_017577 [Salix viminalis]